MIIVTGVLIVYFTAQKSTSIRSMLSLYSFSIESSLKAEINSFTFQPELPIDETNC
jgi:hypothetical protein